MKKRQPGKIIIDIPKEAKDNYCRVLEKIIADIDMLVNEIEYETVNNTVRQPQEIIFDVVPIIKKLRDSQKEARTSLMLYTDSDS